MRRFRLNILLIFLFLFSLCGCTYHAVVPENLGTEASQKQQQEVKTQIIKLLEEEYKQPFKLLSFKYKYTTEFSEFSCNVGGVCPVTKVGRYYFKVQAVNNPIIIIDFKVGDYATKESIKWIILWHRFSRSLFKYKKNLE